MSDANELHPVGLVASSVDPTIKSATSAPVGSDPKERFKALEGLASTYLDKDELALLENAFRFAEEMHAGQKRKSGEAFVIHPVEVAIILADLHMDVETLIAALLHDTVEDTVATKQQVAEMFGDSVAELVDGVTKITKIEVETLSDEQAETFRKMLVAMSKDIRVIVIKLADRLHNMRTLSALREDRRIFKARETLEIYAPIAHRLGISSIKWELEDLAFFYLEPAKFKQVSRMVAEEGQGLFRDLRSYCCAHHHYFGERLLFGVGRGSQFVAPDARALQRLHRHAEVQHVPELAHYGYRSGW